MNELYERSTFKQRTRKNNWLERYGSMASMNN